MATTISEIAGRMSEYPCEKIIRKNSPIVSVRYLTKNSYSIYVPYCLYIGYASNMPREIITNEMLSFLVVEDAVLPEYLVSHPNFNSIILRTDRVNLFELYNQVQNLLSIDPAALSCSYDMTKSLSRPVSVQEMLNIAYQYLENPVMLTNLAHQHVAHAYGQTRFSEPVWDHYVEKGYCSEEMVQKVNGDIQYRCALKEGRYPVTIDYIDIMNYRQMTMPIRMDGINVAFVSVLEVNKPFTPSTRDILEVAARLIAIKIRPDLRFAHSSVPEFDALMQYILNTPAPNEVYVTLQLKRLNIQLQRPFMLFSLEDTQGMDVEQKMPYITTVIDDFLPSYRVFLYQNKTLVLYDHPSPPDLLMDEDTKKKFDGLLKQYQLLCGVSRVFGSLMDLSVAYEQTQKAIQFGGIYRPQERIHPFDNYIMENLLNTFLEHDHINNLIDPKLRELMRNDKLKNSDLTATLRAYLQFDCDMRKTSEYLHVHYNTLKYRLQRIREVFYMPLSDTQFIFQLKLSFLAMDLNMLERNKSDGQLYAVPHDTIFDDSQ